VAQDIEKEVVVTKEYTPNLEIPDKLAVAPRMDDTVALHPELNYAITPVAWNTVFEQRPIAAANTSVYVYPFQPMLYIKAGAGYPLNSLCDLNFVYSTSARNYVGVDVAHRGQWCNIADLQGIKRNAAYSDTRLKLFGSHSIGERFAIGADIDASHDMRHYYGDLALTDELAQSFTMDNAIGLNATNPLNAFGVGGRGWIGSDFTDLVLAYAWPEYHPAPFVDRKPAYAEAVETSLAEGRYVGGYARGVRGIDCGGFVTILVQNSGLEPKYNSEPAGATERQEQWVQENNWLLLNPDPGTPVDTSLLQAGDVAFSSGHTFIYVGDIPGFESNIASASIGESSARAPMAGTESLISGNGAIVRWYRNPNYNPSNNSSFTRRVAD
jgi:hypothetical protein